MFLRRTPELFRVNLKIPGMSDHKNIEGVAVVREIGIERLARTPALK